MARAKVAEKEKDFQTIANEHGHGALEWMREHMDDQAQRENIASEDALEVSVRGDWHTPGDADNSKPTEYYILLGTGGPATRITGKLDEWCQPEKAVFEYQD